MANNVFLDIQKREEISDRLKGLKSDTSALFGIMTAQHMVEHLLMTLELSAGKGYVPLAFPIEKAEKIKGAVIHTSNPLPLGFKSPLMPSEGLPPLLYPNLSSSVQQLERGLDEFERYYGKDRNAKLVNPSLGELNYEEWLVFHGKHFSHHFKQFGLW